MGRRPAEQGGDASDDPRSADAPGGRHHRRHRDSARTGVQPFTDKQIELVTTFADQAVIAIENVRLFDEVQARTRELSEALEQQTATSEVLHVISSSPGELEPVFQAMLANATRICEAKFGIMWLSEGDAFRVGRAARRAARVCRAAAARACDVSGRRRLPLAASLGPSKWSTSPTSGRSRPTSSATAASSRWPSSAAPGRFSSCRCSRRTS